MASKTLTSVKDYNPNMGGKMLKLEVTGTTGDSTTLTLANYGLKSVESVNGWVHATTDSVIIPQDPITSVSSGVLTLTFSSSLNPSYSSVYGTSGYPFVSKKFVFLVYGDSE